VDTLRNLLQQRGCDLLVGWVVLEVDGNEQLLGLGIYIADINSSFVRE
jgi:hypothetical protein